MKKEKEEIEYVGTKAASKLTGLSQQTIRNRCNAGYYETANHDDVGCPWRISKEEVLKKAGK